MTEHDLFGIVPQLAARADPKRGPKGGKHYTRPNGYAASIDPDLAAQGKCCRHCRYYVHKFTGGRKSYPKCERMSSVWTSGRSTDILASHPACKRFEKAKK